MLAPGSLADLDPVTRRTDLLFLTLVAVAMLIPSAAAEAAVTRLRLQWTSSSPNSPPQLRALTAPEVGWASAGCWPPGTAEFGPCPAVPRTHWAESDFNAAGVPQAIAYVDETADQHRDFQFEVVIQCPGGVCPSTEIRATITDGDGSTTVVPAFTLGGPPDPNGGIPIGRIFGTSAGAPVLGKTVRVEVVSGDVFVKCPGGARRRLGDALQIRLGCQINANEGSVRLTSARPGTTKVNSGVFREGTFKPFQSRKRRARGLTELRLAGPVSCPATSRRHPAHDARRRHGRHLWGHARGPFRTRGRRSAATVTGTTWLVEDRCDGSTLTKVRSGRVTVRDFVRHRSVRLRAGESYVAGRRSR